MLCLPSLGAQCGAICVCIIATTSPSKGGICATTKRNVQPIYIVRCRNHLLEAAAAKHTHMVAQLPRVCVHVARSKAAASSPPPQAIPRALTDTGRPPASLAATLSKMSDTPAAVLAEASTKSMFWLQQSTNTRTHSMGSKSTHTDNKRSATTSRGHQVCMREMNDSCRLADANTWQHVATALTPTTLQ